MIRNKYAAFALFVVLTVVLMNLLEYLYCTFLTHSAFSFSGGVRFPLVVGLVVGYLAFLRNKGDR